MQIQMHQRFVLSLFTFEHIFCLLIFICVKTIPVSKNVTEEFTIHMQENNFRINNPSPRSMDITIAGDLFLNLDIYQNILILFTKIQNF